MAGGRPTAFADWSAGDSSNGPRGDTELLVRFFRRQTYPADLIPLAARPEWERYSLFEARGEESHPLADHELAERCGVGHHAPLSGARFGREEMCDVQWSCTAAYYEWLDAEIEGWREGVHGEDGPPVDAEAARGADSARLTG